ncbi:hypothetical protein EH227_15615 [Rouxiella chamberiensis]|jgi:hypothetical protein|nr:hypothetical protein EH227_15615 [Rouxiella chamberiensis]
MLLVDSAIKPVVGHLLLVQIDVKHEVYRLVTIVRRGLESLIDKADFIAFYGEFLDEGIVVEGVVAFIINDAGNQVFDDTLCICKRDSIENVSVESLFYLLRLNNPFCKTKIFPSKYMSVHGCRC